MKEHRVTIQRLERLLSLASVSSTDPRLDMSNKPVIDCLATELEGLGFRCEVIPCGAEGKFNLIATAGSGPGGLVLAGHTDTVPFDGGAWSVEPLGLSERDGKLYGLGATDMKGFFPLVMAAAESFASKEFKEPLIVLATADEESSMSGARHLAALGRPRARAAVIGEPTGMRPVRAHKGIMMESVRLTGRSGHSSDPSLGRNALDAMHAVISDLMRFRAELRERYQCDLFAIPQPTMNLGVIHGGDNPNRICGHCALEFDIRLTPGMHLEDTRELLRQRIARVADPLEMDWELTPLFPGVPAFAAAGDSPLLSQAAGLTGSEAITVAFATEAPYLQSLGMDTIVMGPGDIAQAHQPDEYLALDALSPCIEVLRSLIARHCLTEAT